MVFFRRHKALNHKQCSTIGFVLSVLSLLTTAVITFVFPRVGAWLNASGVYHLDFFLLAFMFTLFMSLQGLLLFGFPLYYVHDKKCHMTGFQILLYAIMWMILMAAGTVVLFGALAADPVSNIQSVSELM